MSGKSIVKNKASRKPDVYKLVTLTSGSNVHIFFESQIPLQKKELCTPKTRDLFKLGNLRKANSAAQPFTFDRDD